MGIALNLYYLWNAIGPTIKEEKATIMIRVGYEDYYRNIFHISANYVTLLTILDSKQIEPLTILDIEHIELLTKHLYTQIYQSIHYCRQPIISQDYQAALYPYLPCSSPTYYLVTNLQACDLRKTSVYQSLGYLSIKFLSSKYYIPPY